MMNILTVTNMYPNKSYPYFGIFVKEIVDGLLCNEHNVDLVNVTPPKAGGSYFNYIFTFFILAYKRFFLKYDVVYCHHAFCVFICKILFYKNIIYANHEGEFFKRSKVELIKDFAVKLSKVTIFVNSNMLRFYQNKYNHKVFYFLPCGLDFSKFPLISKSDARGQLGLDLEKYYIFFPADPSRYEKGYSFLEKAVSDYKSFFTENDVQIITGGSIEYQNMYLYYSACNVVLSCSLYESDGMIYKESLACSRPFLSKDVGNARYYSRFGAGFIFDDVESMIGHLKDLMLLDKKRSNYDCSNLKSDFSIKTYLDKLTNIMKTTVC